MINRHVFNASLRNDVEWHKQRRLRITASTVGAIVKSTTEDVARRVIERNRSTEPDSFVSYACCYGKKYEPVARRRYGDFMDGRGLPVVIYRSGLLCNKSFKGWGASPDAIINVPSCPEYSWLILEIKTVYDKSPVALTLREIVRSRKNFYLKEDSNGKLYLNPHHSYSYQIQTQLGIAELKLAHLCVFLPRNRELFVLEVHYSQSIWDRIIEKTRPFVSGDESDNEADYDSLENLCRESLSADTGDNCDWLYEDSGSQLPSI